MQKELRSHHFVLTASKRLRRLRHQPLLWDPWLLRPEDKVLPQDQSNSGAKSSPGDSDSKEFTCSAGEPGSIPGSGRCPGEENGDPLQSSCLGHPMDRGAWRVTVHGAKTLAEMKNAFDVFLGDGTWLKRNLWAWGCIRKNFQHWKAKRTRTEKGQNVLRLQDNCKRRICASPDQGEKRKEQKKY